MSIVIRDPRDSDFFPWLTLYEGYAAARGVELTEQKALLLWTWLTDPANVERALVAVDDEAGLVGLAHFRSFPRPLDGDFGVFVDAFHVAPDAPEGAGDQLLAALREAAAGLGATVIQWTTAPGEQTPAPLADGDRPTELVVHELQAVAQPA